MKWSGKVDERTRQKIELLYREFDKFIHETHEGSSAEDAQVLREWESFKGVIERDPSDLEAMHQHISKMGEGPREDRKESRLSPARSTKELSAKRSKGGLEVDRAGLKRMTRQLSESIQKNTREMFKA